jgi:4-amino-4-deoxy-L-arabinose transferase-like glycosyltransferase
MRASPWALAALTGLALALRLFRLGHQDVWIDEAFTAQLLDGTFADLIAETARDNHPPLYYAVLYLLRPLGRNAVILRLPSVIVGTATVPLFYVLARRLLDARAAAYAALLLAVSPLHVYYSQEARMYALLLLLVVSATLCFLAAARTDHARHWAAYAAASAAAFYVHLGAAFVTAALAVHHLAYRDRRFGIRRWVIAHLAMLAAVLPWVAVGVPMLARVRAMAVHHVTLSTFALPYTFATFCLGYFFGPSVADWHRSLALAQLRPAAPVLAAAAATFGGLAALGLARLRREPPRLALLLVVIAFVVVCPYVAARALAAKYNVRYALAALPFFLIVVAAGLGSLRPRARAAALVSLLSLSGYALHGWYFDERYAKERTEAAVAHVRARLEAGDAVLAIGVTPAVRYYWPNQDLLPLPPRTFPPGDPGDLGTRLATLSRLWLISGREWDGDPRGDIRRFLEGTFRPTHTTSFQGVTVTLYLRPGGPRRARTGRRPLLVRARAPASFEQLPLSPCTPAPAGSLSAPVKARRRGPLHTLAPLAAC